MEHGDRNADIRSDLEIITSSMHMLPPWVPVAGRGGPAWWSRFEEFDQSYSLQQLAEYLAAIIEVLDPSWTQMPAPHGTGSTAPAYTC